MEGDGGDGGNSFVEDSFGHGGDDTVDGGVDGNRGSSLDDGDGCKKSAEIFFPIHYSYPGLHLVLQSNQEN